MKQAVAIDLGGTQIRAAIIDQAGSILRRAARPTPAQDGPEAVVRDMAACCVEIMGGVPADGFAGIGVCSPGPIDTIKGVTLGLPNFKGFDVVPLRDMLRTALGRDVVLENDAIAAAMGEWRFGAGLGCQDVVYITVSTGIGGGVIASGQVLRGRKGMAGHFGHLTLVPDGLQCNCGNKGCWEMYACGPAFQKRAETASGRTFAADAASVFAAARAGDGVASMLVREEARFLGIGIVSLLHLFSPERVILGGGLSHHFDLLKPGIDDIVQTRAMKAFRDVDIVQAEYVGNSGLLGAAALVL